MNKQVDPNEKLEQYRCKKCKRLLCYGTFWGTVEIKCDKCKYINKIER